MPGDKAIGEYLAFSPFSNTGVKMTEITIGLDWYRCTMPRKYLNSLIELCENVFNSPIERRVNNNGDNIGSRFYRCTYRSSDGLSISSENRMLPESSPKQHLLLDVPAQVLNQISEEHKHVFLGRLQEMSAKTTRIDLRIDDYAKQLLIEGLYEDVRRGNFTGFRSFGLHVSGRVSSAVLGQTLSFGARGKSGTGKYLRIYDKEVESKGKEKCLRLELELSKDRAQQFVDALTMVEFSQYQEIISATIFGAIKFVKRESSGRLDRAKEREYWQQFKERVYQAARTTVLTEFKLTLEKKVPTIASKMKWLEDQVSTTLAMMEEIMSIDDKIVDFSRYVDDLVEKGKTKFSNSHYATISSYVWKVEQSAFA